MLCIGEIKDIQMQTFGVWVSGMVRVRRSLESIKGVKKDAGGGFIGKAWCARHDSNMQPSGS